MYYKKLKIVLFFFILYLSCYASNSHANIFLKFGLYSSDKPSDMVRKFRPILNILQQELSLSLGEPVKIKIKVANSYNKGISDLVNGSVDFARFGTASYLLSIRRNPDITIIVKENNKKTKKASGVLVVNKKSAVNLVADLAGKSFAFGNENSTLGRYFAQDSLYKNGVKANDLSSYKYLGRHDRVAAAVYSGQFDAGSFKIKTFNKFSQQGKHFKVLVNYPNIYKFWLAREGLDKKLVNTIKSTLLNMKEDHLQQLKHAGFSVAHENDFKLVNTVVDKNHLFFEK